ncbi:type II restriction endonuclease [Mycoplasmopsis felis]|nr:type II restriction endonuclease [Mycoplasmopsis felis]UWW01478.1 type II restriction endonuclease [Mycoplasmopsis felis]WAM02838.1 type II restriction endonuclease [Mycoplasmopsis felis]
MFRFKDEWNSLDEYLLFLDKTGLLDLISNKIINNLVDYVLGVEVGLDSNSRKNRTGKSMEV